MKIYPFLLSLLLVLFLASCASAPKIVKDDIEPAMVAALKWQEANPRQADRPTDWTHGAYYTGVARAHAATGNPLFLQAIQDHGTRHNWSTWERPHHADDVAISYSYLHLNEQKPGVVDLQPTDDFLREHLYEDNQWKSGDRSEMKHILWWWCDALFMAPPVIAEYAALTGEKKYLDAMHQYYRETYDLLYHPEEHLFARDTRYLRNWAGNKKERQEKNGELIFWSRGNGWVLGGLALLLDELPADYEHRDFYLNLYREMAAKIKDIQPADGMWRVSLLDPDSWDHGETSGTGFYTFALAWGINNGILDRKEYLPAVAKAWKGLREVQQASGKVGWVQDIGADPQPASADSYQNFGTGAFLLAGSEVMKL